MAVRFQVVEYEGFFTVEFTATPATTREEAAAEYRGSTERPILFHEWPSNDDWENFSAGTKLVEAVASLKNDESDPGRALERLLSQVFSLGVEYGRKNPEPK